MAPHGLLYSEEHNWVEITGNQARIGITANLQSELGDVVFVELPEVGEKTEHLEPFGSVESVKTVSELYAPVSGTIIEINEELEDHPEIMNDSSYKNAWIIVVELADNSELDHLLSKEQYEQRTAE
ncbi:glycine cleavage system protein GcvH [Virgibacillus sp. W0430]|uniref:glycine cleavage system protein GcvH n=1 Tax=Virgibacillus sp. W0430 TaxID=3391580 RepID=UPI003F47ADF1